MSKLLTKLIAFAGLICMTASSYAVSYLPAGTATALTTDITDTHDDVMAWVWAIFPIIALGWFAFNQARKGAAKFGAK